MDHLMACPLAPACTYADLNEPTDTAVACAKYWSGSILMPRDTIEEEASFWLVVFEI